MKIGIKTNLFSFIVLIALSMTPFSVSALPRMSRTVCGKIQDIDHSKHSINFFAYSKPKPMIVEINDRTKLFRDGDSVPFDSLENGIVAELVYKAPLFGERFALKLRWATKGDLISDICKKGEGRKQK